MPVTFGKTGIGAGTDTQGANLKEASKTVAPNSGTVTKVSWYLRGRGLGNQDVKAMLYADNGSGAPGALLAVSSAVTVLSAQAAGWVDFAFGSPPTVVSGTTYWISIIGDVVNDGTELRQDTVAGGSGYNTNTGGYAAGPTNPYGAFTSVLNFQYSAYATMTVDAPVNTVAPVASGTTTVGSTLSVTNGTWTGDTSGGFTYQWQRDNSGGGVYSNIGGAVGSTYLLVSADVGCNVRCRVIGSSVDTASSPVASNSLGLVTQPVPTITVAPVASGTPASGSTLSTTNGTWTNSPTGYAYQWQRDNAGGGVYSNIGGATAASYLLTATEVGCRVRCMVTASNAGGNSTPSASNALGPVTGAVVVPTRVPLASFYCQVAWAQQTTGLFTFGISKFGGTDRLAADAWSTGFLGPYDNVIARVRSARISRGRDDDLSSWKAGQIDLTLADRDGLLNPQNGASPLAGYVDTDRPVRFGASYLGTAYPLFYGFITDIEADLAGRGTVELTAVDFLDKLDRQNPSQLVTLLGNQTTGDVIAAVLNWMSWTDPAMRNLGVGDSIIAPYTLADGETSALSLIQDLLAAERGILFASNAGVVKYRDRKARYIQTSVATIDRVMTAFPVGRSNQDIVNRWTVQRTDMAGVDVGVPQTWPDPAGGLSASQQAHGVIQETLSTPLLNTDTQALNLAQYLILRTGSGRQLVYEVPIDITDAATMQAALGVDVGDRVTMTIAPRNMAQFTSDFYVESIDLTVDAVGSPRFQLTWRVSAVVAANPFRFGSSLLGGTDQLYY